MKLKTRSLYVILGLLSFLNGFVLSKLDFFGFLDGRHAISFTLLGSSILCSYLTSITVFLLDYSNRKKLLMVYACATGAFMLTFYLISQTIQPTIILGCLYFLFLLYIYKESQKRSLLYVHFSPREIFFPVMKNALVFMLAFFAATSFYTAEKLLATNRLLSPPIIKTITKPFIFAFNKEFSVQMKKQLADSGQKLSPKQQDEVTHYVLRQTVDSLADRRGRVFGLDKKVIDTKKVIVKVDGSIDVTPMFDSMIPSISQLLTIQLQQYRLIAPFAIAVLTFLLLQPLIIPFQLIEMAITAGLFKLLFATKFLNKRKEMREIEVVSL